MKRIGVAFTKPRGEEQRRDEYGVYLGDYGEFKYVRYEGYRKLEEDGTETMVGLPLAGPHASFMQHFLDFYPNHFAEVRYFDQKEEHGDSLVQGP